MNDDAKKIIAQYYQKLPFDLKNLVNSQELLDVVERIAQENIISPENHENLLNEVLFVILGIEPLADFKENLTQNLNISTITAQRITSSIEEDVFHKVTDSLMSIQPKESLAEANTDTIEDKIIPKKEEILNTIENPKKQNETFQETEPSIKLGSIIENKLNSIVSLPQEKEILAIEPPHKTPEAPKPTTKPTSYNPGNDPYREPLE